MLEDRVQGCASSSGESPPCSRYFCCASCTRSLTRSGGPPLRAQLTARKPASPARLMLFVGDSDLPVSYMGGRVGASRGRKFFGGWGLRQTPKVYGATWNALVSPPETHDCTPPQRTTIATAVCLFIFYHNNAAAQVRVQEQPSFLREYFVCRPPKIACSKSLTCQVFAIRLRPSLRV